MKDFRKLYLRGGAGAIALFVFCCAVFAAAFWIYGLPLGAVGYPALVCAVLWLIYAALRYARAVRKHKTLSALTEALTEDMLPEPQSCDDADYRRFVALLQEARRTQEAADARRFADMMEYYTLWAHQIKTPIAAMRLTLQNEDVLSFIKR